MSTNTKITMVGGGSYNWCPRLICDLIQAPELENSDVFLLDINLKAAEEIKAAADRLCRDNHKNFRFIATANEEEAFNNTDFVIITISTGGLNMMKHDIEIPENTVFTRLSAIPSAPAAGRDCCAMFRFLPTWHIKSKNSRLARLFSTTPIQWPD